MGMWLSTASSIGKAQISFLPMRESFVKIILSSVLETAAVVDESA
jgi:hypothetical protein